MRKDELDGIRKRSRASNNGPWVTDTAEMYKKTIIRRHCKSLQLSPDKESDLFAKALEADNEVVGIDKDTNDNDPRSRTERVKDLICGTDADFEDVPQEEPQPEPELQVTVNPLDVQVENNTPPSDPGMGQAPEKKNGRQKKELPPDELSQKLKF